MEYRSKGKRVGIGPIEMCFRHFRAIAGDQIQFSVRYMEASEGGIVFKIPDDDILCAVSFEYIVDYEVRE